MSSIFYVQAEYAFEQAERYGQFSAAGKESASSGWMPNFAAGRNQRLTMFPSRVVRTGEITNP
jgi:hypothetical protein